MASNQADPGRRWMILSVVLACALVGWAVTGYSMKISDSAGFCGSCHIMNEAVLTHAQSAHVKFACNECHAPPGGLSKVIFKAKAGSHDIYVNTMASLPDLPRINPESRSTVTSNCLRCHSTTVSDVSMLAKPSCSGCHRGTPHKHSTPIASRRAADG